MGVENIKKAKNESKKGLAISILKIILLLTIVVGIPLYIGFCRSDVLQHMKSIDDTVELLQKYETTSIFIYIGLQIMQVVISFIPGQVVQMAAGYLYGFWSALLFAMTGAVIGTAISFGLAKILGRDFLHLFFGEEKMSYYIERLNSKKVYVIIFLIYLIPGVPKDMVSYAAGVSEIRFKPFIILSAIGRIPGMVGSLLIGNMLNEQNYIGVIIVAAIACITFGTCVIFRKKINAYMDKFYNKISK